MPRDFSVTGVAARHWAEDFRPPLTAADIPAQSMGAQAVELLLERIATPAAPPRHILHAPPISLRGSTGPERSRPAAPEPARCGLKAGPGKAYGRSGRPPVSGSPPISGRALTAPPLPSGSDTPLEPAAGRPGPGSCHIRSSRVHFWLLPPRQVQICTLVPLAVPLPDTSRHLPLPTAVMQSSEFRRHFWLFWPLQSQMMHRGAVGGAPAVHVQALVAVHPQLT